MQSARIGRSVSATSQTTPSAKNGAVTEPSPAQAAAYIHDMTSTMRQLAVDHKLTTLALLLEMAAVEAGSLRAPQARDT